MIDLTPAATRTAAVVHALSDEHLDAATPNEGWPVRTVVHHILGLAMAFADAAGKVGGPTTSSAPQPDDGPLPEGWRDLAQQRLDALAAAWSAPAAWEGMTTVGGVTLPGAIGGLVALDEVLLHGWDVAVATGQSYEPSDEEAQAVLPIVTPAEDPEQDAAQREGMFGPARQAAGGATLFQQVVAMSGRDPQWAPS